MLKKEIKTQRSNSYDCGVIAIQNALKQLNKKVPSLKLLKIDTKFKKNKGNTIWDLHKYLILKDDLHAELLLNRSITELKGLLNNNHSLIVRIENPQGHFSNIIKIDKKDVYLTNIYNKKQNKYLEITKIPIAKFKEIYNWVLAVYDPI